MNTGIRIIWRICAVVVLCLMIFAYVLSMALRSDPVVSEEVTPKLDASAAPKLDTVVQ